jgi:transcription factor TFIIIB component B''
LLWCFGLPIYSTFSSILIQGLQQFGSDFAMIQQLFPDKSRDQVQQKFKTEEKKHPKQVHDAIIHRSRGYEL